MVDEPSAVIYSLIITSFKGIAPQVGYQGSAQFDKRLAPYIQAMSILLYKKVTFHWL